MDVMKVRKKREKSYIVIHIVMIVRMRVMTIVLINSLRLAASFGEKTV